MADIKIAGTLRSGAADGKIAVASEVFDEPKGRYQSEINDDATKAKVVADKAAADIGVDSTTLLQGGIDSDGKENTSSYFLRTSRFTTFKLEVNNGYTIGQLAQYDLAGNFVALYNGYPQIEGVEWTPQSVVATDKNYYWVAIVFKGNSPNTTISYREDVVKSFASGLYYYMQGGESDPQSAAQQAKTIVNRTIEQLPNEEDLTLSDGKMQLANRAAEIKDDKVSSLGYVVLRKNKSFAEQVKGHKNTIFEVRYNFDLGGVFGDTYNTAGAVIPENCVLKFNGGKISNGSIFAYRTRIDANPVEIFDNVTFIGNIYAKNLYIEWWGGLGDVATHNNVNAMHEALNAKISGDIQLLPKKYYFAEVHPDDATFESKGNTYTNEGFSILMKGSKTIKGFHKKTIITTARTEDDNAVDNSLILMIDSNNIVKDLIVEGNSAIDKQDKTSIGIQMGIFVFNDTETIIDEVTGVKYGEFSDSESPYAINGGVTNVSIRQCAIGLSADFQWDNNLNDITATYNRIGVLCRSTTPHFYNLISERNKYGLISTNSGVTLYNSTFQGNAVAIKMDSVENLLEGCYFENNIEERIDTPFQGWNFYEPGYLQGNLICGTIKTVGSLTLIKNKFTWGGALCYVDKCNNFSVIGKHNLSGFKLTENCKTYYLDNISSVNLTKEDSYRSGVASSDKVSVPFLSIRDFSECAFSNGKLAYYKITPIRFIGNTKLEEDDLKIYRTSDGSRSFAITINDFSLLDKQADLHFVFDVEIPKTKSLSIGALLQVNHADGTFTAFNNATKNIYGSVRRLIATITKADLYKYKDTFVSIKYSFSTYKTGYNTDVFVSEEDDLNVNPLIIRGIYIYSGDVLVNESLNSYKPFAQDVDILKVKKALTLPTEKIVGYKADDEYKIIYSDARKGVAIIKGNQYQLPNGISGTDYGRYHRTMPEVAEGDKSKMVGYDIYDTKNKKPLWWNGEMWVDAAGQPNVKSSGSTSERPTGVSAGFQYFDSTLSKPIWWNGTAWVDSTGTEV